MGKLTTREVVNDAITGALTYADQADAGVLATVKGLEAVAVALVGVEEAIRDADHSITRVGAL